LQVGIDPTGQWDSWSPNIVWSGTYTFFDTWGQLAVEAVAQNDVITVFMRSAPNFPVKHNDMYWDDAALVALGPGGAPPTATAVPPATAPGSTPAPTSPPQPTVTCSPPPEDWVTVTVQRGDTLYALARRHGTTLDAAVVANCLRTTDIYVGQVLWLPPLVATATAATATAASATPTVTPPSQTETATPQPSPTDTPTGTPTAVPATATPTATTAPVAAVTATSTVPASATPTRVPPSATMSVTPTSAAPSDGGTRPCGTLALSAGIVLVAGVFSWRSKKH